jgi:hypothetical protein
LKAWRIDRVREFDPAYKGDWISLSRFRVKKESTEPRKIFAKMLPHIRINSATTGQEFTDYLLVDVRPHDASLWLQEIKANGYGMGTETNKFWIPMVKAKHTEVPAMAA